MEILRSLFGRVGSLFRPEPPEDVSPVLTSDNERFSDAESRVIASLVMHMYELGAEISHITINVSFKRFPVEANRDIHSRFVTDFGVVDIEKNQVLGLEDMILSYRGTQILNIGQIFRGNGKAYH